MVCGKVSGATRVSGPVGGIFQPQVSNGVVPTISESIKFHQIPIGVEKGPPDTKSGIGLGRMKKYKRVI